MIKLFLCNDAWADGLSSGTYPDKKFRRFIQSNKSEMRMRLFNAKCVTTGSIPKVFQKLALDCVKAPAVESPQAGLYLEHKTRLRESQPRGFDAVQGQLLKYFRYILGLVSAGVFCSSHSLHADSPKAQTSSDEKPPYDADLFNKDKSVYFVNAEFLYWIVNEGAVDYAVKMKKPAWSTTQDTFAVGNYRSAHFDWSPGFRINFGYFRAPHYWDVFLQYTYVPSSGRRTVHSPSASDEFLNGTWIQPDLNTGIPPAPLQKASCHINLKYNVLDFLFSRRFHTNEHLRFSVLGGLTSALIFQKMKVSYHDVNGLQSHIENRWRFEGVGFRAGVKVDWYMGYDIYMVGLLSTAALTGWYKNTAYQNTTVTLPGSDNSRPIRNSRFHDNRLTYTAQFMIGPSWQKRFEHVRTEIVLGYELNIWANLHQIYRSGFAAPTAAKETFINNSNISLQGLTLRMNLDF